MTSIVTTPAGPGTADDGRRLSVLVGLEGLALGGCPINALDLGRTLRARGHRVEVFAIDEQVKTSLLPYAERSGFTPTVLPQHAGTLERARQIRRLALESSADVVHVFGPWLGRAATMAVAGATPRSAVVTNWMMENVPYVPRRTPLVLGTRSLRDEAERMQGRHVWLMEPPVDLDADAADPEAGRRFRREVGIGDDELAVVVVGRVDAHLKEEGLGHAIDAVERLDLPALRLVVVGDGDAFERVAGRAAAANERLGRPAVVLTGSRQDPRPAYDAADVALGMGGSALRALAHARPLVVLGQNGYAATFDVGTREHFATEGFFGEEPVADPAGHLAHQLERLLDPVHRAELAAFGHAEVQRYGLQAGADQLEALYRTELRQLPGLPRRLTDAGALVLRAAAHDLRHARTW
ncbi:glycosyltransferase family 4 protein [Microlunatus flavus]|uniref:glycosyltransferase family 4 protein n=1 Tax=Microlunatus flavus TaxID=1036181 RepID=UPI00111361E4|nr:glycosyltransferase family 4 protein [Microlunatus flavus]